MLNLTEDSLDASALLQAFEHSAQGAGAIVSFSGLVRPEATGGEVQGLFLQAYSPMTENGIQTAIDDAKSRWPLSEVMVAHRIGEMKPGDTIVFVATASKHRRAAFEAADFLMDYLKTKAVFWKRESTDRGDAWIEPREEDYSDADRWVEKVRS
nr:molybdenum cofactor biosynthesis protein MoaE [Hyphomonas sp. Mor2]